MNKKIFITGSLGQVGSYLCENFLKNNEVIGIDNEVNSYKNISNNIKKITIKDDICNKKIIDEILKNDIDIVIHCASQISVEKSLKNPIYDVENNIIGTINLLESSVKNSIKHFIYFSSAAVYGNPINLPINEDHPKNPLSPYGISKLSTEKYVYMYWKTYQLPITIIRPFNIYSKRINTENLYSGVIAKFIDCIKLNKSPIIEGDGKQTRDFIYIKDVIEMINLILEKKESIGEIFNCGYGKPITINQLADNIIKTSEKNIKLIHTNERIGDIKYSYADINKSKKLLNFKPKVDIQNGLNEIFI